MILLLLGLFSCVLGVPTYGGEDLVCQRTPYYDESASLIKVTFINSGLSQHFDLCAYNSDGGLDFVGFLESNANTNVQISKGKAYTFRKTNKCSKCLHHQKCIGADVSSPVRYTSTGDKDIKNAIDTCTKSDSTTNSGPSSPTTTISSTSSTTTPTILATLADYQALEAELKNFCTESRSPGLLRLSFHDFASFDPDNNPKGGPRGCIINSEIYEVQKNRGLESVVMPLKTLIDTKFPFIKFPFGDVISLAGKVVVEKFYSGAVVKWRFGRSECDLSAVLNKDSLPSPFMTKMTDMDVFSIRYSLNRSEFAMVTLGAHSLHLAANHFANTHIVDFSMSPTRTSFLDYIANSNGLDAFRDWVGFSFTDIPSFGRFFSDMVWLPSISSPVPADAAAVPVETFLKSFKTDGEFNVAFGNLFSKFLETGTSGESLQTYN